MKRPASFIACFAIVLVTILFFNSCQEDAAVEVFEEEEYLEKIEAYEAKIKDLETKIGLGKSNRKQPKNIISFEQAQKIYQEYDKRADLISGIVDSSENNIPFEPTRSMFYEISELRHYLSYIDELSQKAGIKPTGLRFYFALYPDTYVSSSGSDRNAKRQTIFIAPTLEKKYNNRTFQVGYTLDSEAKVILLDKDHGFSHYRRDRNNKHQNPSTFSQKTSGNNQNSLIANDLGATPPEFQH
ncbi:hypothetical protein [Aquimarina algiphila]|uniref:hypothetical protein n=1 Tax=Aquimarina algiphila TaxID=2047982 RepID=UPI0023307FEC|nr:hypothetical protein [Aquimarina algiphila]